MQNPNPKKMLVTYYTFNEQLGVQGAFRTPSTKFYGLVQNKLLEISRRFYGLIRTLSAGKRVPVLK
jgi:hypothetical protein